MPAARSSLHPVPVGRPRSRRTVSGRFFAPGRSKLRDTQSLSRRSRRGADSMHARFYNPQTGRFLSTDPADSAIPTQPQSWNKYGYVLGNPLRMVDPDGQVPLLVLVPVAVVGGLLFGAEAANAPESPDAPTIKSTDGMKAIAASSVMIATAAFIAEKLGGGSNDNGRPGVPEGESSRDADVRGLEKQLEAHERELEEFKKDPDRFDNKGFLKDAESPEQRQKIIDGRIRNLERQTENFRRQIEEKRRKPPAT